MTLTEFSPPSGGVRPALERYDRMHDGKTWIVTSDRRKTRFIGYALTERAGRAGARMQIEDGYDEVFLWTPDGRRYYRYYRDEHGNVVGHG